MGLLSPIARKVIPTGRHAAVACWQSSAPTPAGIWRIRAFRRSWPTCAGNAAMATVADADRSAAEPVRPSRQRIAANFLTLTGTGLCGLLVTIVVSAYVRRALGPAAIGQLSWAVAAVSYLTVFANPGL